MHALTGRGSRLRQAAAAEMSVPHWLRVVHGHQSYYMKLNQRMIEFEPLVLALAVRLRGDIEAQI